MHAQRAVFLIADVSARPLTSLQWRKTPRLNIHTPLLYEPVNCTRSAIRSHFKTARAIHIACPAQNSGHW